MVTRQSAWEPVFPRGCYRGPPWPWSETSPSSPRYRAHGLAGLEQWYATRASHADRLAFGVIGVHRVGLQVYDFNPRARHVYEKLGFIHEGTMRDALRWDGRWVDCHLMALLDRDWKPA